MKPLSFAPCRAGLHLLALALACVAPPGLSAQIAVYVVADSHWVAEGAWWQSMTAATNSIVLNTNALVREVTTLSQRTQRIGTLLGDPAAHAPRYVGSVPDVLKPAEDAVALETTKHALESSRNLFGLGSRSVKTYRADRKVEPSFNAYGETLSRDEQRYVTYAMQEAMLARCRTAATNEETVAQKEIEAQRATLEELRSAGTHTEVALATAKLTASQQRQSAAHQKVVQARADEETFRQQLTVERERKAEADREWAQAVIEHMRRKALAAYNNQVSIGGGDGGN